MHRRNSRAQLLLGEVLTTYKIKIVLVDENDKVVRAEGIEPCTIGMTNDLEFAVFRFGCLVEALTMASDESE